MAKVLTEQTTGRQKARIDGVGQYGWVEAGGGGGGGGGAQLFHGWAEILTDGSGAQQVFSSTSFAPDRNKLAGAAFQGWTNGQGAVLLPAGSLSNLRVKGSGLGNGSGGTTTVPTVTVFLNGVATALTLVATLDDHLSTLAGPLAVTAGAFMQVVWSIVVTDDPTNPVTMDLCWSLDFTRS